MKARRQPAAGGAVAGASAQELTAAPEAAVDDEEDLNSGFGTWLRSADGIAYMRLFVVANSLVMFMTLSWPQISVVLEMIGDYFAEWK